MAPPQPQYPIPAVVVGLCSHGLALVRALASRGVTVHAIESQPGLPGLRTQMAQIHMVPGIHGEQLIQSLIDVRTSITGPEAPVLFLTNDRMIENLAGSWPRLEGLYQLSWSESREEIAALLSKTEHERLSLATRCNYPSSYSLRDADSIDEIAASLSFPVIAKPAMPLSSFKTAIAHDAGELLTLIERHPDALPILVQRFIPGGDELIHFCAVYLKRGEVTARFDGRKLRSRPMGHTTVAEPFAADDVFDATRRFFASTSLSGPASLELKRDEKGALWVIEPTVGRTDFWIQVCVSNGLNLPWIEYCDQANVPATDAPTRADYTWVNTERDPKAIGMVLSGMLRNSITRRRLVLPYLSAADPLPVLRAVSTKIRRNISNRIRRSTQVA